MHGIPTNRQREDVSNPYLLRRLLWCDLCLLMMVPVLTSVGLRKYGCPGPGCERPLIEAEAVEQRVWNHFALLNEAYAAGVAPECRRQALREFLCRIRVGHTVDDLYHDWRD